MKLMLPVTVIAYVKPLSSPSCFGDGLAGTFENFKLKCIEARKQPLFPLIEFTQYQVLPRACQFHMHKVVRND